MEAVEYYVAVAGKLEKLTAEVNRLLALNIGWSPQGGILRVSYGGGGGEDFFQSMIRYN